MHNRLGFFLVVFFLLSTIHPLADDLYLKNGRRVQGTFLGGDSRTVRFLLQDGQVGSFAITDVESIIFGTQAGSAASPVPAPAQTPAPADPYRVPHGTVLVVRMVDSVDSDVNKPGETFRATLEEPIAVGGNILASKDTPVAVQLVHVKQSGQLRGEAEIALQLRSLTLHGETYSLASEFAQVASEGKGGGKRQGHWNHGRHRCPNRGDCGRRKGGCSGCRYGSGCRGCRPVGSRQTGARPFGSGADFLTGRVCHT